MPGAAAPSGPTQLPEATAALLVGLGRAHSFYFPNHSVPPNTSEITTPEQRQDAEQKIVLLKSVLSGWMQGVEMDLERRSSDLATTYENLLALSQTLPGSFCGIKAKPRFLLYTSRSSPSSTARIPPSPSLLNGSPKKGAPPAADAAAASAQPALSVEGLNPEEDLATFLLWRSLNLSTALQATLLEPHDGVLGEPEKKVRAQRQVALDELEGLVKGILGVLCESAVRIEWRSGLSKEVMKDGGIGKAKELVEELLKTVQAVIPSPSSPSSVYPRTITLFDSSRAYQLPPSFRSPSKSALPPSTTLDAPRQPSITLQTPLHAQSLALVALRTLLTATSNSEYLADYRPLVSQLLVASWPVPSSLRFVPPPPRASRKGKERASEEEQEELAETVAAARTALARKWLDLTATALKDTPEPFAAKGMEVLTGRIVEELQELLEARDGMDVDGGRQAGQEARAALVERTVEIVSRLWLRVKQDAVAEGAGEGLAEVGQMMGKLAAGDGVRLVEVLVGGDGDVALQVAALLVLSLPLIASSHSSPSLDPPPSASPLDLLPPQALVALDAQLAVHVDPPLPPLPPPLARYSSLVSAAWSTLVADHDARHTAPADVPQAAGTAADGPSAISSRKRRWLDETDIAPSSDGAMDVDGAGGLPPPTAAAKRRRGPWKEAVRKVVSRAREEARETGGDEGGKLFEAEGEAAEHTVVRLAQSLSSNTSAIALVVLRTIGLLACARSGCLVFPTPLPFDSPASTAPSCSCCDTFSSSSSSTESSTHLLRTFRTFTHDPLDALVQIAPSVLHAGAATKDEKLRLAMLNALVRLLKHTSAEAAAKQMETASFMGAIRRELEGASRSGRMASGNVLLAILQAKQESNLSTPDVADLFKLVDVLFARDRPAIADTTVQLVGKLARMAEPQGLLECESLVRLLRLLGDRNAFLKSMVKLQIGQTAMHRNVKPYGLIQPHFAVLGPVLLSSTATLSAALQCFHQSRESLLRVTREHTLPEIILKDQKTLLQQVAEASRTAVPQMLCEPAIASAIVAHLFMQSDHERQRGLAVLTREMKGISLHALLESINIPLVFKLALELGNEDPTIAAQAERALKGIERARVGQSSSSSVNIAEVLKNAIVGLLSHMNRGLHDPATHRPLRDKQKIIRSLDAVTARVGRSIAGFSPQIMATLQTALELPGLRLVTLNAFGSFLRSLKFSDIGGFIGPTTASFVRLWPDLTEPERVAAKATIDYLVVENAANLSHYVKDVADLSGIEGLESANNRLQRARAAWSFELWCGHLLDRIAGENDIVTLQALRELKVVLEGDPKSIQALSAGDSFDPFVGRMVAALLGAAVKDGPENEHLRNAACECIGIFGALDPDRFELPPVDDPPIVLEGFENMPEAVSFALRLIEDLLVGAYRSTNDTRHQELLAYAIQELLRFCGFTSDLILSSTSGDTLSPVVVDRWQRLPKTVVEACAPLLSTRFSLGNPKPMDEAEYPIYSSTPSYRDWIRSFANDLLVKVRGSTARQVFSAFSGLLHLEDTIVAQYLLPHLLLHVLIFGQEADRVKVKQEIETVLTDQVSPTHNLSANSRLLSAQTVFSLMDHLSRWITLARKRIAELKASRKKSKTRLPVEASLVEGLVIIEGILQDIPHILVGQAALTCKSYARSLLNFESHIVAQQAQRGSTDNLNKKDRELQVYYENLHECYAHLDEPDGMEGISTKILSPSVLHQIREHESTGRWTSAQSCWEVKLQQKPDDPVNHVGLLRCLRNLGHYDSMRTHIVGLLHSRGDEVDWERILAPFNIEASLFVGDWDSVEDALEIPDLEGPEAAFGRVLCAMRDGDEATVERAFYEAREQLGGPLVAAGRESYRRVYDSVIHLHVLDELKAIHHTDLASSSQPANALVETLRERLSATSPSFRAREPILNLGRTAFRLQSNTDLRIKELVGDLWLETSKIARKAGHYQTAYSAILQARDLNANFAFLQSAKLFKANGEAHKAIQELDSPLRPILSSFQPDDAGDLAYHDGANLLSKASLRRARWMLEAGRVDQNEAITDFYKVVALAPNWETPYYYLGHFWDRLADAKEKKSSKQKHGRPLSSDSVSMQNQVVKLFARSLGCGTKYIYQALPRLLTIWLEMGERPVLVAHAKLLKSGGEDRLEGEVRDLFKLFRRTNDAVHRAANQLPVYQWLTVLPQLVSRILHANEMVHEVLTDILLKVLESYPHHGFWAMASGAKSNTSRRQKRNTKVFQKAKSNASTSRGQSSNVSILVDEGLKLVDQLLNLCNHPINGKVDTLSMKKTFPGLYKTAPTSLIIPLQSSLTVSLPFDSSHVATHKPFPPNLPVFQEFEDVVSVMSSLQKPRKITVRGDDGGSYGFLCKPKDDLRKDARLMEFNSMIIKLLKKDSDARSRKLNIRTYSVVPLNEECGLIEWVPHVVVLRGLLTKAYTARGIPGWSPELKKTFDTIRDDPKKTGQRFENEVLSHYPSVFHDWFLETFPEPSAWHRARLAYSRTAAVISMVGFVLGLGDRHCENILLDGTTGDTVHVDFNCLFDKGRTFEVAEKVPFRLTHNIIDGMGVTGVEGVYRRSAEITLRILRANKDSLRSVLETFMHDPLVEWAYNNKKKKEKEEEKADAMKAKALEALEPISNKLLGLQVTSDPESLSAKEVSVEEQVERLIREARDPKNLGAMYVGWCSWF
ncbi:hypothetical protein JCM8547_009406 [Rhodosporidiobolus lusitaniae]